MRRHACQLRAEFGSFSFIRAGFVVPLAKPGIFRYSRAVYESLYPPNVLFCRQGRLCLRQRIQRWFHQRSRERRIVQQVPPILHGSAEAHRHVSPYRKVRRKIQGEGRLANHGQEGEGRKARRSEGVQKDRSANDRRLGILQKPSSLAGLGFCYPEFTLSFVL